MKDEESDGVVTSTVEWETRTTSDTDLAFIEADASVEL
jgi:hypothetical protein